MKTYETIIDLLHFEGPGLQDYVTAERLQQLIDGTLAPAAIADEYLADLADSTLVAVATTEAETRTDLLTWIRWEIEIAVEQRKQQARDDAMVVSLNDLQAMATAEKRILAAVHADKVTLIAEARRHGASKAAIADALGISRPTLDKWLNDQEAPVTFTSSNLRDQVVTATNASDGEYDVDAIVEAIIERHGAVPVDTLDSDEFWGIVMEHAK